MDCKNCSIINICKIYDIVKSYSQYADINITQCQMKQNNNVEDKTKQQIPANPFNKKIPRDFTSASNEANKIREQEYKETIKEKTQLKIIPVEEYKSEHITCPNCNGETTDDDLKVCSKCNKTVCSNCCVEDPETHNIVCEQCF